MSMPVNVTWSDLQTKGYVVIPGWLPQDILEASQQDFRSQPRDGNRNYGISMASAQANARLRPLVNELLALVRSSTDLHVDLPAGAAYFATGRGINFSWHQDHESFYTIQNHYDYLNFYIPIIKPRRDKSNLSIVPLDVLEREAPRTYRLVARSGANRFVPMGQRTLVLRDDVGVLHLMRPNIEELATTPLLDAGDLLLMRGDVIHRTQDMDTERVAMSFRASNSQARVTRARLADGGWFKARMMSRNATPYRKIFKAFDLAGTEAMSSRELMQAVAAIQEINGTGRKFLLLLAAEKLRAGVLARFVPKVFTGPLTERSLVFYVTRASRSRRGSSEHAGAGGHAA